MNYNNMSEEERKAALKQRETQLEQEHFLLHVQDVELQALVAAGFNKGDVDLENNLKHSKEMVRAVQVRLEAVRGLLKMEDSKPGKEK